MDIQFERRKNQKYYLICWKIPDRAYNIEIHEEKWLKTISAIKQEKESNGYICKLIKGEKLL